MKIKKTTRGERVIAFIEKYCRAPEGEHVGKPLVLSLFQRKFICDVYDNPHGTSRGYLSIARKNGKTALIAGILLAHLCGPEARTNTQIVSGALSREQAGIVFSLAVKMVNMSPEMSKRVRIMPSAKSLIGLAKNVEYRALSAEGKTAHGLSPVLSILDEVGQVRGPRSDFIDAIITAQGAHADPLVLAISTQAPNDGDLFSIWLDDAMTGADPHTVVHIHAADKDASVDDPEAWAIANPALGVFRSRKDLEEQADRAKRMPSFESTFRNLCLNQRVETVTPFVSRDTWGSNSGKPDDGAFYRCPVYVGVDLSAKTDLTAVVLVTFEEKWHVKAFFWTPENGLKERSKRDRAPYDVWVDAGLIHAVPGASIDYSFVARDMGKILHGMDVRSVAFDRWRFDLLKKELDDIGVDLPLVAFGQGFKDMAPAIDTLETHLLNGTILHGGNPVLTMCVANTRVELDAAGNRKMNKAKATGRIDGAVALAMAFGTVGTDQSEVSLDEFIFSPVYT